MYHSNDESDDVIYNKNTESRISPEISKQCSSNLAPAMYITKEKLNDTYYVAAIAILLAPFFFCEKPNIPICNLLKWDRGS